MRYQIYLDKMMGVWKVEGDRRDYYREEKD